MHKDNTVENLNLKFRWHLTLFNWAAKILRKHFPDYNALTEENNLIMTLLLAEHYCPKNALDKKTILAYEVVAALQNHMINKCNQTWKEVENSLNNFNNYKLFNN